MGAQKGLWKFGFFLLGIAVGMGIGLAAARKISHWQKKIENTAVPDDKMTVIAYPFDGFLSGWSLVLCEMDQDSAREFRLYDEAGELVQVLSCSLTQDALTFRFDRLFHSDSYDKDFIIFPANAADTGAMGLCYPWDAKEKRFLEEPIEIPWYQACASYDNVFMVSSTAGDIEINALCRINEQSRQVVELRRWMLTREETKDHSRERALLHIWDCLEQKDIFFGYVERDALGNLVNDKYYQFLFHDNLPAFWQWEDSSEIGLCTVTENGIQQLTFADKEALLEAYGFAKTAPFYEYFDLFHNKIIELYFDAKKRQGCGILYAYNYNYDLEKVTRCWGFYFDKVERGQWEEDTFSMCSYDGENAKKSNVSGYRENYVYTDDKMLSTFEARGTIVDYGEDGPEEARLLFMDYVYRNDCTLYFKQYHHHHILFGTSYCEQSSYYDKQGRLAWNYAYVTHGSYNFFYIYQNDRNVPAYCLWLDMNGGNVVPTMIAY